MYIDFYSKGTLSSFTSSKHSLYFRHINSSFSIRLSYRILFINRTDILYFKSIYSLYIKVFRVSLKKVYTWICIILSTVNYSSCCELIHKLN
nr:MAG TPA: hypothetical protein [Bacteriophage sp.]